MQCQWIESNSLFLDYIRKKHEQSTQLSLIGGDLVVIEVDKNLLPKFDTKEDRDIHVAGLKF